MATTIHPGWEDRKRIIAQRWPLLSDKDLETLERSPENIIIKLQKFYQYTRIEAFEAYYDLINTNVHDCLNETSSNKHHH